MVRAILPVALVALFSAGASGADDKAKSDPPGAHLEVTITGKAKYALDLGGATADDFTRAVRAAEKAGRRPTAAPAVDLTVEIKNTADKPVTVWIGGDPVVLTLTLKGKGAVNAAPALAFTEEFRSPRGVEIAAGKTHSIPVKALQSGYRGAAHWAYWTAAGDYELTATLATASSPAPKGAKDAMEGFGRVTLTSAPFKIVIEEKK
ncbi:MAG: hypothetical protein FJ304_13375 [Planctomycetes bacterium]|nr:hypothetical protein [Planctomycetota bacterium]